MNMKQMNQVLVTVILLLVIGFGGYFGIQQINNRKNGQIREAVFLSNGQVYFGYVTQADSRTITLKNIYYLQVQQPLQPPAGKDQQQPQISLVKLGNELHGPTDEMVIVTQNVLFREKMKSDSKVNQAIADFQKNGGQSVAPAPAATNAPATPAPAATK